MELRPDQVKPNNSAQEIPLTDRLENAKIRLLELEERKKEIFAKQEELNNYEFLTDVAYERQKLLNEYKEKLKKILDEEIIIDPNKGSSEMISFKGVSESANAQLVYDTGVQNIGADILSFYKVDKNPLRRFEITELTETTLGQLFSRFNDFLDNQLRIPKMTDKEAYAINQEVTDIWNAYTKTQQEVRGLEEKINSQVH